MKTLTKEEYLEALSAEVDNLKENLTADEKALLQVRSWKGNSYSYSTYGLVCNCQAYGARALELMKKADSPDLYAYDCAQTPLEIYESRIDKVDAQALFDYIKGKAKVINVNLDHIDEQYPLWDLSLVEGLPEPEEEVAQVAA